MTSRITLETFSPHVNEDFFIRFDDDTVITLKLVAVDPLPVYRPLNEDERPPFSLKFEGPVDKVLSQATYPLQGEGIDLQHIFLVPVGQSETAIQYEAVFN